MTKPEPENFTLMVITKKERDKEVNVCCVECLIGKNKYQTKFETVNVGNALEFAKKYFNSLCWYPVLK